MYALMGRLCKVHGIAVAEGAQEGVEIVPATDGENEALFVLNHNRHTVVVPVDGKYTELLNEQEIADQVLLKPYEVAVLRKR